MKLLGITTWYQKNRLERVNSILDILNRRGQSKAVYCKGRSFIATLLFGKGHPKPVDQTDEWNYVRVTYQGKYAFEIFYSKLGSEGRFFDDNFTEDETQYIINALAHAGVDIKESRMKIYKVMNLLSVPVWVIGFFFIVYTWLLNDMSELFTHFLYTLCFFLIFWITYWKRGAPVKIQ
jgi:hypothetical protein